MMFALMSPFDGAKICKLIGLYVLDKLSMKFGKKNMGLYQDNRLSIYGGESEEGTNHNF